MSVPSGANTSKPFYLALSYSPTAPWIYSAVQGAVSGSTVTFTVPNALLLNAGTTYTVAVYQ